MVNLGAVDYPQPLFNKTVNGETKEYSKVVLDQLGAPNKNGRIYSADVIQKAIKSCNSLIKSKRLFILHNTSPLRKGSMDICLDDICGYVDDIKIVENTVVANITAFRSFELLDALHWRPNGIGNIDDHGNVSNYTFHSFTLTNDPA